MSVLPVECDVAPPLLSIRSLMYFLQGSIKLKNPPNVNAEGLAFLLRIREILS